MHYEPGSPEAWVEKLTSKLTEQDRRVQAYGRWYDGDHPQMFVQERWRRAFGGLFDKFSVNYTALVADSIASRLRVVGFRMGEAPEGDRDAWAMWQRSGMDAESALGHLDSVVGGVAFGLVWPDEAGRPVMSVESGTEVVVANEAGNRRRRAAAMKRYRDEWGVDQVTLFLPDRVVKMRGTPHNARLETVESESGPNPLGVVPVVPLTPAPRLGKPGQSLIHRITNLQGALNRVLAYAIVAGEINAFPQKWATGLADVVKEEDGTLKAPFELGLDEMVLDSNHEARFGQFQAAQLTNYTVLLDWIVEQIASLSSLPYNVFPFKGQPPSGEAITSAEGPLFAVVDSCSLFLGESWEEMTRLGFRVTSDPRADAESAETIWEDTRNRSEAVVIDAAGKKVAMGIPLQVVLEDTGKSPTEIRRIQSLQADEALQAGLRQDLGAPRAPIFSDSATARDVLLAPTPPSGGGPFPRAEAR